MAKLQPFTLSDIYEKGKIYALTAEDSSGRRVLVSDELYASRSEAKEALENYDEEDLEDGLIELKVASFKPSLC